ncbi:hypothetical protein HDU67_008017 [Dinochytrium kinnereticum]|nr:hypothetical protein HDU67_008017 [Dinochytrium kinnereticum]
MPGKDIRLAPTGVKRAIAAILRTFPTLSFNEILAIGYLPGQGMSWHSDDEPGVTCPILSWSIGTTTVMQFREKRSRRASKTPVQRVPEDYCVSDPTLKLEKLLSPSSVPTEFTTAVDRLKSLALLRGSINATHQLAVSTSIPTVSVSNPAAHNAYVADHVGRVSGLREVQGFDISNMRVAGGGGSMSATHQLAVSTSIPTVSVSNPAAHNAYVADHVGRVSGLREVQGFDISNMRIPAAHNAYIADHGGRVSGLREGQGFDVSNRGVAGSMNATHQLAVSTSIPTVRVSNPAAHNAPVADHASWVSGLREVQGFDVSNMGVAGSMSATDRLDVSTSIPTVTLNNPAAHNAFVADPACWVSGLREVQGVDVLYRGIVGPLGELDAATTFVDQAIDLDRTDMPNVKWGVSPVETHLQDAKKKRTEKRLDERPVCSNGDLKCHNVTGRHQCVKREENRKCLYVRREKDRKEGGKKMVKLLSKCDALVSKDGTNPVWQLHFLSSARVFLFSSSFIPLEETLKKLAQSVTRARPSLQPHGILKTIAQKGSPKHSPPSDAVLKSHDSETPASPKGISFECRKGGPEGDVETGRGVHSHIFLEPSRSSGKESANGQMDHETPRCADDKGIGQPVIEEELRESLREQSNVMTADGGFARKGSVLNVELRHGDILIMDGESVQKYYEHRIVKVEGVRFAMTLRSIGSSDFFQVTQLLE